MAKLYFKYGTMDASKSADLLMTAHKYEQQGKKIICMRSNLDLRNDENYIQSRALAYKHQCFCFSQNDNLYEFLKQKISEVMYNCILIDEAQFLSREQVFQLTQIVDFFKIPVLCYGLKNSYIKGKLFEGASALLYYADSIQEIKSVCTFCNSKAIMNLRVKNNKPIMEDSEGNMIVIGDIFEDKDYFISTCRKHYFNPPLNKNE